MNIDLSGFFIVVAPFGDYFNRFTALASIEKLFSLNRASCAEISEENFSL